jgi:hypothetical protein
MQIEDLDEAQAHQATPEVAFYTVALYLEDRVYGGAEEGGWYYTAGRRVNDALELKQINPDAPFNCPRIFHDRDEAYDFAEQVNSLMREGVNKDRRPLSSVLSTGRYAAHVCAGYPNPHFPSTRPHYE